MRQVRPWQPLMIPSPEEDNTMYSCLLDAAADWFRKGSSELIAAESAARTTATL